MAACKAPRRLVSSEAGPVRRFTNSASERNGPRARISATMARASASISPFVRSRGPPHAVSVESVPVRAAS